jgi:hypothetical protein
VKSTPDQSNSQLHSCTSPPPLKTGLDKRLRAAVGQIIETQSQNFAASSPASFVCEREGVVDGFVRDLVDTFAKKRRGRKKKRGRKKEKEGPFENSSAVR